jgi:hypothetical protein
VKQWLLLGLLALLIVLSSVTSVDQIAETDHAALFKRSLVTFALARTLNGLISAAQGTEIALQPAGVGVTFTPGQVLDPVNDLIERFSWIMLGATISLGVQQVLLDIGQWWVVRFLVAICGLVWLAALIRRAQNESGYLVSIEPILLRVFVVVIFLRFAVPLTLIANEALFELFLQPTYLESTLVIETAGAELEQANQSSKPDPGNEEPGIMNALDRVLDSTRESLDFSQRVEYIKQRAGDVIEHLIHLSVVFILQAGVLPLAFLWMLMTLLRAMIRPRSK